MGGLWSLAGLEGAASQGPSRPTTPRFGLDARGSIRHATDHPSGCSCCDKDESVEIRLAEVGEMTVGYFRFAKGTDLRPALAGLPGDMCQCPHWGYPAVSLGVFARSAPFGTSPRQSGSSISTGQPGGWVVRRA